MFYQGVFSGKFFETFFIKKPNKKYFILKNIFGNLPMKNKKSPKNFFEGFSL